VAYYNTERPHQGIGMTVPADRFGQRPEGATSESLPLRSPFEVPERAGQDWVARRAGANGVVSVSWQQVCLGQAAAGRNIDVHVTDQVLQFYDGNELLRTVARTSSGPVRKKRASVPRKAD
jgi:hypothetical protein